MTISRTTPATGSNAPKVEVARSASAHESIAAGALISVGPAERITPSRTVRPDASFVAHLIAMAEQVPQTRTLRRETPAAAHAMYGRAMTKSPDSDGRVLSQVA